MESVVNKVALITGASSGIGAAAAVLFAKYGSRLVLTGRNQENLNATMEACTAQGLSQDKVLLVPGDVTKDEDLSHIVDSAVARFNAIDILVNSAAGIFRGNIHTLSMDTFDEAYRTNLRSVVSLTTLALPHLKKNKGSIVNVSSFTANRPAPAIFPNCVMKAGIEMVTQDLALELAPDEVRVNAVRPGYIRTAAHELLLDKTDKKALEEYYTKAGQAYPLGRVGMAEEVAQAIVFLASEASAFTTGASLALDGGITQTMRTS